MAGRGEDDWGRWCHKNMPHLYNKPALARHDFTIDISRDSPGQDLGFAVDPWKHAKGLRVIAVRQSPPTPIVDWNENCRMWFPRDQLRVGDVIRQVNEEKGRDKMVEKLKSAKDVLMLVLREGSCEAVAKHGWLLIGSS